MVTKTLENAIGGRHKARRCVVGAFLLAAVIGLLALTGTGQQVGAQTAGAWSTPVNLSESDTASVFPDIAVDSAGHVYVVWGEFSSDGEGWPDMLMFTMWDGQTWSPPNDIGTGGHLPQISVDSQGRLHLIRVYYRLSYSRSWAQEDPSNAQAWTPTWILGPRSPYWPDMVVDSQDRIHVVFRDTFEYEEERTVDRERLCATGCRGIFYTRSVDGGGSWSDPIQLDTPIIDAETPRLAVDRLGNVYTVWTDTTAEEGRIAISFSFSTDGGETWVPPREVVAGGEGYEWPQIAVDSVGTIHVVWRYRGSTVGTFGYVTSWDKGDSWSQVEISSVGSSGGGYSFGLAVDSADNLHLVMQLAWGGLPTGIAHLVHPPDGQWSPPTRLSLNPCSAGSADVELVISQGNRLHVVWYDRLECELGFAPPFGRGEVFYSTLTVDAPAKAPEPLPPMPTPTAIVPTAQSIPTPAPASVETGFTPEPTTTNTATATRWSPGPSSAEDAQTGRWVPNPLLVGPALAGALVGVVVILKSAMTGRR